MLYESTFFRERQNRPYFRGGQTDILLRNDVSQEFLFLNRRNKDKMTRNEPQKSIILLSLEEF